MTRFILRRFAEAVPLLLAVIVLNFLIIHAAPGDPVQALIGDFPAPPEYVARMRQQFGLDLPLWQQLLSYVTNVLQGDLGFSFANRRAVSELLMERLGNTLILTVSALLFATFAGVALGISAARRPRSGVDHVVTVVSLLGFSIPVFWLGQLLILGLAVKLEWLPAQGMVDSRESYEGLAYAKDVAAHLLLPALALSLRYLVSTARLTRASMLEALASDYIVTAKAKGVRATRLLYMHALPNALLPVVTSVGYNFGYVLAGSALIETVFSWPGLGRLLYDAMLARDTPVMLGIFLVGAGTAVLANLVTDLAYGWLDPRIRHRKR